MDYKAIINLMKEMNQTELTKLEIEAEGLKICIEKDITKTTGAVGSVGFIQAPPMTQIPYQPAYTGHISATVPQGLSENLQVQSIPELDNTAKNANSAVQPTLASDQAGTKKLVSPMVGTFYAAASPEKPPFVKVGDTVKKGQTICIIEAMKLMNEIESEYDGEIVEILVNNEDMVEYGQPLFVIK